MRRAQERPVHVEHRGGEVGPLKSLVQGRDTRKRFGVSRGIRPEGSLPGEFEGLFIGGVGPTSSTWRWLSGDIVRNVELDLSQSSVAECLGRPARADAHLNLRSENGRDAFGSPSLASCARWAAGEGRACVQRQRG